MNRKKLNIIKRVLDTDYWYLREDKNKFPDSIFVFNGNGKLIMEYYEGGNIFYDFNLINQKIQRIFGFNLLEINKLMKDLIEEHFGWEGGNIKNNTIVRS